MEASRTLRAAAPIALFATLAAGVLAVARGARLDPADFAFANGVEVSSLDPHVVTGIPEGRVMQALFEGLTVLDPRTLATLPGTAASWDVCADGLAYTFHIRPDARWSNGDPVTAHDFEWSWRRSLDPRTGSGYGYQLWYVRGARRYSTEIGEKGAPVTPWEDVGVEATDEHTLEVALEHPTPYFLFLCAFHPLYPVHRASLEAARARFPDTWEIEWVRPENLVTNGPYTVAFRRVNDRLRLVKSDTYWDARNVALRTIDALAIEQVLTGLNTYLTSGHGYMDRVPTSLIPELLPREDFAPAPHFGSYFYRVNVTRPPFDDARVRRALALAIPRVAICEKVTKAGEQPAYSLVPPLVESYAGAELARGDLDEARRLLAEAGFGPGDFPTFELHFNTSEMHRDIAEVVADAWRRELGLDVKLRNQEWKVYLATQQSLGYDVSRSNWVGDYPDPNTFLDVFVTGGANNRTGWSSARYDELVTLARKEPDTERRLRHLSEAEALLMSELPVLPVYFYVTRNLRNPRLGGFHENALDLHFPKFWYLKSDAELARERAELPPGTVVVDAPGPEQGLYAPARRSR